MIGFQINMGDNRFDDEDRKLFVGGLPQDCSQDDLKQYLSKYGEMDRVQLKTDYETGRSRGFAFVVFSDVAGMEAALADEHEINGKRFTAKKAVTKPGKIYVGRLPSDGLSDDDIRNYFASHGTVTEFIRPIDRANNNQPKNFAFITFVKEAVCKQLIEMGTLDINGHEVIIKEANNNPRDGGGRGGGRGGYGGGYGGHQQQWGNQGGYGGAQGGYGGYGGGGQSGYDAYGAQSGGYGGGGYGGGGYGGY